MKIHRTQYVTSIWTRAATANPSEGMMAVAASDNILKPVWFEGTAIPNDLFANRDHISDNSRSDEVYNLSSETEMPNSKPSSDTEGEAWSEDSDSEFDE